MDSILDKLVKYVAKNQTLTLQVRLFRLICLITAFLCIFVIGPCNFFEPGVIWLVPVAVIGLGLFSLFCYFQSCRGKQYIGLYLLVLVGAVDPIFFLNGATGCSITYFFFPLLMVPMVTYRGRARWFIAGLMILNVGLLMAVDYCCPSIAIRFATRYEFFLDNFTGIVFSTIAVVLVMWVVVTSYDREQVLLDRYARDLALSEENYRSVVENAKSIILRLDPEGRVAFFNKFAENIFGYPRGEIIGKAALGTIVPSVSSRGEELAAPFQEMLRYPEKHPVTEGESLCRDGRRIRVTWTNQPVYDGQGKLREILCVGTDMTRQMILIEQLRLTQLTMDAAAEQIIWVGENGRINYANAAALAGLGYSPEVLRTLTLAELTTDMTSSVWADLWARLKRDRSATLSSTQRRPAGSTVPVELSFTYLKVANKEYTIVFVRDLTERLKAEEKRRQHEQQMQHLQRLESLGVLAGGIAHDFNNLLTVILANVSMVRVEMIPGSDSYAMLDEAERASLQAKGLTAQLLTFSKGGKPVKSVLQLAPLIRESAGFALRGQPVVCDITLPPELHAVEADPAQLSQVFNNLIINARQAMPKGGQINVRARNRTVDLQEKLVVPAGEYVEVTVQDQGGGIAPEDISKIFDPYFTTKKNGAGLGLAVVHSIVNQHRGAIFVRSAPNEGTAFTLLLPAAMAVPVDSKKEPETAPTASARRVLIMDDEVMVSRALARVLGKLGCEVETVTDGQTALQRYQAATAEKRPFDFLVMDLTIPGGMGGLEAIRQLKQMDPAVKAIVSSGYSDDPVMADYQAYGFTGVILKPYNLDQVKGAVRPYLNA